jgi:phosphatidylinositol alpha-1,6-mannosyltransferase
VTHLFVTNDFPPKIGGIQSYVWELWRRLPADRFAVLTTRYPGAAAFDAEQPFRVIRDRRRVFLPTPSLRRRIERAADDIGASAIVLDPALPLGALGPSLSRPYALVLHGAGDVTVYGRIPLSRPLMARTVRGAALLIAAGGYPADEAARAARGRGVPETVIVPPGVDATRFVPLSDVERKAARARFGIPDDGLVVVGLSRLVARKGFDVLIEAAAQLAPEFPNLVVAIGGGRGPDQRRLERILTKTGGPARLLGRIADDDLPAFYGCADVFAQPTRGNRWFGLEQEGFGIIFLEAAACAVAQVAGRSGGSHEAVVHGQTGLVVDNPRSAAAVAAALRDLLRDADRRARMGAAARQRASAEFDYSLLAAKLDGALVQLESR